MQQNFGDKINSNGFDKRKEEAASVGGAPKGKRVSTILKNLLDGNLDDIIDNPMLKGKEGNEALAVQLLSLAFHKDSGSNEKLSAIKEILDRIEGKPKQEIEQTNIDIQPLQFKIIGKD